MYDTEAENKQEDTFEEADLQIATLQELSDKKELYKQDKIYTSFNATFIILIIIYLCFMPMYCIDFSQDVVRLMFGVIQLIAIIMAVAIYHNPNSIYLITGKSTETMKELYDIEHQYTKTLYRVKFKVYTLDIKESEEQDYIKLGYSLHKQGNKVYATYNGKE